MKQTVNLYDFRRAFETVRPDQFTYEGLKALFEYFEEYEESTGEELELDVIAICCEYSGYSMDCLAQDFGYLLDDDMADDDDILEELADHTTVIHVNSDFYIIQDF